MTPKELEIKEGEFVIVETARGVECGEVVRSAHEIASGSFPREIKPVIRLADGVDVRRMRQNRADEKATFELCEKRIAAHKLQMKLVDAEYTLDRSKLVFYLPPTTVWTSASWSRTCRAVPRPALSCAKSVCAMKARCWRLGVCGQPFCCSRILEKTSSRFPSRWQRNTGLSLNPAKISGACGRLMCCLAYEQKSYEYLNSINPAARQCGAHAGRRGYCAGSQRGSRYP